jgi:hypothetical protein
MPRASTAAKPHPQERVMNNSNPDLEQEEQERREQELRDEQERMTAMREMPGEGDESKDPVIINRGG